MSKHKFIVIKGRNIVVGQHGLHYEIFDTVCFDCKESELQSKQRKYVFRKLHTVDKKHNPLSFRKKVFCRRRHILKYDGTIFADRIKIFDYENGTYYGFIPVECFKF